VEIDYKYRSLVLELLLVIVDETGTLEVFTLANYDTSNVLSYSLSGALDFRKAPDLAGNPSISLAFNIRVNMVWSIDPSGLEECLIFIGVAQIFVLDPLRVPWSC